MRAVLVLTPLTVCLLALHTVARRMKVPDSFLDPCDQKFAVEGSGFCKASILSFSYNKEQGKCQEFLYLGCDGNQNRFRSLAECQAKCEKETGTAGCGTSGDGIVNPEGKVCCPKSCGTCGGSGCDKRPGGSEKCCTRQVTLAALYCSTHPAPCVIDSGPLTGPGPSKDVPAMAKKLVDHFNKLIQDFKLGLVDKLVDGFNTGPKDVQVAECFVDSDCGGSVIDGKMCGSNIWGLKTKCECKNWKCSKGSKGSKGCFPGSSQVQLTTGESRSMADLRTGDSIMTIVDGKLTPTAVLGFLFKKFGSSGAYITIHTEDGGKVSLSGTHVMFVNDHEDVLAEDVNIGDFVIVQGGDYVNKSRVVKIEAEKLDGAYVPLTEHGTLLVDGVLASSYTNGPHDWAHVLMTPARWFPALFLGDGEGERVVATTAKHVGYYLHKLGLANYYHSNTVQRDVATKCDLNSLEKKTLEEGSLTGSMNADTCPMHEKKTWKTFAEAKLSTKTV